MALEGIAEVQARIQEIRALFAPPDASTSKKAASAAEAMSASPTDTTDFASLLAGASGTGAPGTGTPDIASLLASASAAGTSTVAGNPTSTATQFLATALGQKGKPYLWGATAQISDPNPAAFDCSELVKWAAGRVGVSIPDGANAQYVYVRDHGAAMTVDQALHTPGALLFHFGHEPRDVGDNPSDSHVAISVGDGVHTIEARGHAYGTGIFEATGTRSGFFNYAGMIPGMG
jgi:cell wall-associated NlpC family hydrolase